MAWLKSLLGPRLIMAHPGAGVARVAINIPRQLYNQSSMFGAMTMGTTMQVIAEPRRQAILDLLREEELPVGELVRRLGVSQPLMSKHLRVLKDAGLVEVRADAQRRLYRIRPEPLAEIDHWLAPYRELWSTSLDRLERHLDSRRNG